VLGWLRRLLAGAGSAPGERVEGWPSNHLALRERVAGAAARLPAGSVVCALEGAYLPHGGRDQVWLTVTGDGGTVRRVRTPRQPPRLEAGRALEPDAGRAIVGRLAELGVWSLGPCRRFSYDGWVCAVAVAEGERVHSIQTHNPDGAHLRLIGYILSLVDVPEPPGGRTWALTTAHGEIVVGVPSEEERVDAHGDRRAS
jgi:hypothetical protein